MIGLVVKSGKHRASSTGKRGERGRFITLKTGRVIFIPATGGTKWADVREGVLASQKKKRAPLSGYVRQRPTKHHELTGGERGIEITRVLEFEDGTKALQKISKHGSAESELLAYEFSESIGWDIVPETIMPEGTKDVSWQRWVEGETALDIWRSERTIEEQARASVGDLPRKEPRMLVMDTLLGNYDRHSGNILVDGEGKQWAIDNNQAFSGRHTGGYGPIPKYGEWVARGWGGQIDAARDIAQWFESPAYREYVDRVKELMGGSVAAQFEYNVEDLADWSETAREIG